MLNWGRLSFALLFLYMLLFMCMLGDLLYTLFPRWLVIIAFILILVSPIYGTGLKSIHSYREVYYSPLEKLGFFFFQYELFLWPPLLVGIVATQVFSERRFIQTEIK